MFTIADLTQDVTAVQFGVYIGCTLILFMLANHAIDLFSKLRSLLGLENNKEEERTEKRLTALELLTNQVNLELAKISSSLASLHDLAIETKENTVAIAKIEAKGCTYREQCLNGPRNPSEK